MGILDTYDPQAAKQQALYSGLLGMGAQLLANSGRRYSTTPGAGPGLGASLGQGLLGFQQGADSSMRDSMQGALFGMKMDQAQQEKTRQKAYEDMLSNMANPPNPAQNVAGIDSGVLGNPRPAFNGTPSMANALASPPAAPSPQSAVSPESLALLQTMPYGQGTSALLTMQQDARKEARTPPMIQSFYDANGREYKASYDSSTQSWKPVGGAKSDFPPGMRMGANGPEYIPEYLKGQQDIRRAGKPETTVTVSGEKAGATTLYEATAKGWTGAVDIVRKAQRREGLFQTFETAMQAFEPGAGADMRLSGQRALEAIGLKFDNTASGELMTSIQRQVELANTPKGEGTITENERGLVREVNNLFGSTPGGAKLVMDATRQADAFDRKVLEIYENSAQKNGGIPNPLEVNRGIRQLGPVLDPALQSKLMGMAKKSQPAKPGAQSPPNLPPLPPGAVLVP